MLPEADRLIKSKKWDTAFRSTVILWLLYLALPAFSMKHKRMNLFSKISPETQQLIDENVDMVNEKLYDWIQAEKRLRTGIHAKVIDYLYQAKKKRNPGQHIIKVNAGSRVAMITTLVRMGYTLQDFKDVIDYKIEQWWGDEVQHDNLNPETLFRKSNFPKYVENAKSKSKSKIGESAAVDQGFIKPMED